MSTLQSMISENQIATPTSLDRLCSELETNGIVMMPPLVSETLLSEMQDAFRSQLKHFRLNNVGGFQRTEHLRLMVEDVLTLSQGFVDIGVHPLVTGVIERYVGPRFALCEAKGWESPPTSSTIASWHGDSWYDQTKITDRIPREVKLGFYLTDVKSGAFEYAKGSHGKKAPKLLTRDELPQLSGFETITAKGRAGTAFLFDTSGLHRQAVPLLEKRRAVFYNYHDPEVPIQKEDYDYYRYHPLILNAAFLGDLTEEQRRVLGFGYKGRLRTGYTRSPLHPGLHRMAELANLAALSIDALTERIQARMRRGSKSRKAM